YKVSEKTGEAACPFNYLYWDFLDRNEEKLKGNHRLSMIYKSWEKRDSEIKKTIRENAAEFLKDL
ncbi:MAG: cryptochrome/photolyase family protein, partial [Micavibrio sp.]|nr:cryptochrome/photolyase family protein [Micavibrio sp.]